MNNTESEILLFFFPFFVKMETNEGGGMKQRMTGLILILVFLWGTSAGQEETTEDHWVDRQVKLQYSRKVEAPGRVTVDFSFCREELRRFEKEKEALYRSLLRGRDAHDIMDLYEHGIYRPAAVMTFMSQTAFPAVMQGPPSEDVTVKEIVLYYLLQMKRAQDEGMNMILSVNTAALEEADAWDKQRARREEYPLFGIPVAVKANIGTGDDQPTSAGAKALEKSFCIQDAFLVKKIKEAGGIILAKTNLSEWANYMAEDSANGFSALGGQTRNPYGRFDVGGSSSGSAAAVAAGLVPLAVGTETSGSIIYPSSQNSVVGLKPTVGLVSRNGIIPIAEAQDTAGPMTLSVRDTALLLRVMAGEDAQDPATLKAPKVPREYQLSSGGEKPLEGLRFGLVSNRAMRQYYYREGEGAIQLRIAGELARAGAEVVFIEMDEAIYEKLDVSTVFRYQFKEGVNNYLKNWARGEGPETLAEIIAYNSEKPSERMPLGQELLIAAQDNTLSPDVVRETVRSNAREAGACIDTLLREHHVDLLFTLSNHLSYIYAAAGYPALCVPAGYKPDGEPVGVTFVASEGEEELLLQAAGGYEQATRHYSPPAGMKEQ